MLRIPDARHSAPHRKIRLSRAGLLFAAFFVAAAALAIAAAPPALPAPAPADSAHRPHADLGFDVRPLAPGVYAVIRRNPPGFLFDCNSAFIIGRRGVAVIDAQFTRRSAGEVIAALKKLTNRPVLYVINTHSHDDHISGNQAWKEAYPRAEFVAHEETARDMRSGYLERRAELAKNLPGALDFLRGALAGGKGSDGAPFAADQVLRLENDIALAEDYAAEAPSFRLVAPDRTFRDSLGLALGGRDLMLRFLGRAHTAGDIVVELRRPDIVFSGDLVVWPVPLSGSTSFPLEYATTLERLRARPHATLVPGHGPLMKDDTYLDLMIGLMGAIRDQTEAAVARGDSLGAVLKTIDLEAFRGPICGASKVKRMLFEGYVVQPGVARAFEQASAARK